MRKVKNQKNPKRQLIEIGMGLLVGGSLFLTGCSKRANDESRGEAVHLRGIANGRPVPFRKYADFGAVLALRIGPGLCTATHLSNGFILTAWHCIGRPVEANHGERVPLAVVSPKGPIGIELLPDDYELFLPVAEAMEEVSDGRGNKIKIPKPDLAIIEITEPEKRAILAAAPGAELPSRTLAVDEKDLSIAGYGRDAIDAPPLAGRLNDASASLKKLDPFFYLTEWDTDSKFGAGMQGDSGGPLYKRTAQGVLEVYGVLSSGLVLSTARENNSVVPTALRNRYVRLDRKIVQDWIKEILNHS